MSEMSTMLRCTLDREFPGGSVGSVSPGTEIIVADTEGGRLGAGGEGEFWVRGPNRAVGYLGDPTATRDAIVYLKPDVDERAEDGMDWEGKGGLKTGDVGVLDEEGNGFITDRLKECVDRGACCFHLLTLRTLRSLCSLARSRLIKTNGLQVSPSELEALLLTHPAVSDCAVIGLPSDRFGEIPKGFIVPAEGATVDANEIVEWLGKRTASHKRLRGGLEIVQEIPKSGNGKVLRRILRDRERAKL